jgi:hypothetical protein
MSGRSWWNLIFISVLGLAASVWVLKYTDCFEIIGGLLGLGGAFAWLAFVFKFMDEERLKTIQRTADKAMFESMWARWCGGVLFVAGFGLAGLGVGTIEVKSLQEPRDRTISVYRLGSTPGEAERLPSGGAIRFPRWTCWWRPANYVVKVSGYPPLVQSLKPLRRETVQVPGSFAGPVVLVRPEAKLMEHLRSLPGSLRVSLGDKALGTFTNYDGHSLWIGCDRDVDVPVSQIEHWRGTLQSNQIQYLEAWAFPDILEGAQLPLKPGSILTILLLDDQGKALAAERTVQIRKPRQGYLIEEVLYDKN